ncbi:toll-like receptor 2, partial [Dinothrombium tinctorium]
YYVCPVLCTLIGYSQQLQQLHQSADILHRSYVVSQPDSGSSDNSDGSSWISEELWPKDKTLLHIKIVKPALKEISIWKSRNKHQYLLDPILDFDSPYRTQFVNNCKIEFKSNFYGVANTNFGSHASNIQVKISGGKKCKHLPLASLTPIAKNLSHLVIRETGIFNLTKFLFGSARLDRITRIDIIDNKYLTQIANRVFDGLTRLTYLSIINNENLNDFNVEALAGAKTLEEFIYIGNGFLWNTQIFVNLVRAASARIVPNLIHIHIGRRKVSEENGIITTAFKDLHQTESSLFDGFATNITSNLNMHQNQSALFENFSSSVRISKDDLIFLTQVKYLQLTDCDITSIHPLAFKPLLESLNTLNLAENVKLPLKAWKQFLSIFSISKQTKSGTKPTLEKLDISSAFTMSFVPKDLLSVISKTSVTHLYMKDVRWKMIKVGDIPPMPNLEALHIDASQLSSIEDGAFNGLENLRDLSLKGNYIKHLSYNLLEPLTKLNSFDVSGYNAFAPLIEIAPKLFVYATTVKELNLSYKNITHLQRNIFIGLFRVEKLHLRGCSLQTIEYLTFFPLKSIVYIDLSENPQLIISIRNTDEDIFVGLEAVKIVRMSANNLSSSDINRPELFRRMYEQLQQLDLSHNHIESILPTTFANFTELRSLDLSHNQIKSWSSYRVFSLNNFINTLNLDSNQITHITTEMLGDFRRMSNLSFAHNPLECECEWDGPLLLLDHQQQTRLNRIKQFHNLEQIAHRQQQIVSTAFSPSPSEALPKSVVEWLNTTKIHFLHGHHPLRSNSHYFCREKVVLKKYFENKCEEKTRKFDLALLSIIASSILFLTVIMLIIAFVYHSTIRTLFTMVDDDFLHNYEYDAFVSYNVNDSDWVFKQLIPNLETAPNRNDQQPQMLNNIQKENQIKLCVYDRDFIAGRAISECVTESIRASRKVILVISNNFATSAWCRFETDLAHNTLMDQNREGLILIKLEEICPEKLERVAPQLHFLLKTRIYLEWSEESKEQELFWRKLRRALGFNKDGPYGAVKQYYRNYCRTSKKATGQKRRHSLVLLPSKDRIKSFRNQQQSKNELQMQEIESKGEPSVRSKSAHLETNFNELKEIIVNKCSKLSFDEKQDAKETSSPSCCKQEENDFNVAVVSNIVDDCDENRKQTKFKEISHNENEDKKSVKGKLFQIKDEENESKQTLKYLIPGVT